MATQFQGGFVDWSWMSDGDLLLSGGDFSTTDPTSLASIQDMVRTRLKATLTGWQLYTIGADLQARLGDTISNELNITLRRQINQSLTNQFLPRGSFNVQTIYDGGVLKIFVYINQSLIATAALNPATGTSTIS
jgi:hypothetical protein